MRLKFRPAIAILVIGLWAPVSSVAGDCPQATGVALQVLGSGGPIADDGRASSAYLIWVDGKSRVLIDAGGGTFLRFAEAHASFRDLDFVGLSHFHADHSADFPALLKSGSVSDRRRALIVTGPDGTDLFPGLNQFLASLLSRDSGAYAYLSGYLDGSSGLQKLAAFEIDSEFAGPITVLGDGYSSMQIDAMHVPHGIVPALAFRVRVDEDIIVFSSDHNGNDLAFVEFARNAAVLVMHMPVPEGVSGVGRRLHAPPSVIGSLANDANAATVVLSHFMERSLLQLDENVAIVRSKFGGYVKIASDLDCYNIESKD